MTKSYTVDTSVFVSAFTPSEPGYIDSSRFVALCKQNAIPICAPAILLPEVAAAISRGHDDSSLGFNFAMTLKGLSNSELVAVDELLAQQAANIAAHQRIRGCDAVYVAVAMYFGYPLVTLDRQQYQRASTVVTTYTPAEALAEWSEGAL